MADHKSDNEEAESMLKETTAIPIATTQDPIDSKASSINHSRHMKKFSLTCLVIQIIFCILYLVMARYDVSADARKWKAGVLVGFEGEAKADIEADLRLNLDKYPCK